MMTLSACGACGTGCCLRAPPHPGLLGCDQRSSFTAFYPFRTTCTCMKLCQTCLKNPFRHAWTYLYPQYLALSSVFLVFALEAYPAMWTDCLWSGTHCLRAVCPLPQPASPAFRYISAVTDHSRRVWPIPLMPAGTTYMNYACLKWTMKFHIWFYQSFLCSSLIQPSYIAIENVETLQKKWKLKPEHG